jgi:hypothetical protein
VKRHSSGFADSGDPFVPFVQQDSGIEFLRGGIACRNAGEGDSSCVSCISQLAGACGSLATNGPDCPNADCREAKSGGVNFGSKTKSAPKIVWIIAVRSAAGAVATVNADACAIR